MDNQVKVWNDNVHPFTQVFRGETITIPPKSSIDMDFYDAHSFKSKGSPIAKDGMGQFDPKSFKMIRVEGRPNLESKTVAYKCEADGTLHATEEAMNEHAKAFESRRIKDKPTVQKDK